MEPNITLMIAERGELVANDPVIALQKQNAPSKNAGSRNLVKPWCTPET